jgi:tetratricopeptide (TPR) repeat protein
MLAGTLDDLIEDLRKLKLWAGNPSYESIRKRVNAGWTAQGRSTSDLVAKNTVADCFRVGRRRLNTDLVIAVVQVLCGDPGYVRQWTQALRVVCGEMAAAAQVRVDDRLPHEPDPFTGRAADLERLATARRNGHASGTGVVAVLSGMAGVGKTRLAIRAAHVLVREAPFARVLFVDLRGFDANPAKPPADPAAVLAEFLRLLGVPGHRVPPGLEARTAMYRRRTARSPALVVLDNAADADQVRPLATRAPGCFTLVTSRRDLTDLGTEEHIALDVFTPYESFLFLVRTARSHRIGSDPGAIARIARRCGHLPIALGLVAGHVQAKPAWTLTDHADQLDERHHNRQMDSAVELALDLSYQNLPIEQRRLLRLAALHVGHDLDAHAAAALAGIDLSTARLYLEDLCRDYMLQSNAAGRYSFHDLLRVYATSRAREEDSPTQRRAALNRLFDFYLYVAAVAMDILAPAEAGDRPHVPPPHSPIPALADAADARAWLDAERSTLVAMAAHTASHGWPTHATRLSTILFRYLLGGHHGDALIVHNHAVLAASRTDDRSGQARASTLLGATHLRLGRAAPAIDHLQQALRLFQQAGDQRGQARVLTNLGDVEQRLGHYGSAIGYHEQALLLYQRDGDSLGEAHALTKLGIVEERLGRYRSATDHHARALALFRAAGDGPGEAVALSNLGDAETRIGRRSAAENHLRQALTRYKRAGNRDGEAWTLGNLGTFYASLDQPVPSARHLRQALAIHRESGERYGETYALNGLGEAALRLGRAVEAIAHFTAAHGVAADIGDNHQRARADAGLGNAYRRLDDPVRARRHYQRAEVMYADLEVPEAEQVKTQIMLMDR